MDDNTDKDKLPYLPFQLNLKGLLNTTKRNSPILFSQLELNYPSSVVTSYSDSTFSNQSKNSRVLNISGPNSKVLLNDQSIRNLPTDTLTQSNLNFSLGVNPISSNLQIAERVNKAVTPYSNACSVEAGCVDQSLTAYALSSQAYTKTAHPAVQTSVPAGHNSLSYDSPISKRVEKGYSSTGFLRQGVRTNRSGVVGDVFIGSREKTPKSINTAYWDTF